MAVACSLCPTFAAVALFINNARWDGVPFLLKAGKALASRRTEIRVQFRHVPGNLFRDRLGLDLDRATNELVRCCLHLFGVVCRCISLIFPMVCPSSGLKTVSPSHWCRFRISRDDDPSTGQ